MRRKDLLGGVVLVIVLIQNKCSGNDYGGNKAGKFEQEKSFPTKRDYDRSSVIDTPQWPTQLNPTNPLQGEFQRSNTVGNPREDDLRLGEGHVNAIRHKLFPRLTFRDKLRQSIRNEPEHHAKLQSATPSRGGAQETSRGASSDLHLLPTDLHLPFSRNQLIRHTARVLDRYYSDRDGRRGKFELDWDHRELLIHNNTLSGLGNLTISQLIENLKGLRARHRRSSLKAALMTLRNDSHRTLSASPHGGHEPQDGDLAHIQAFDLPHISSQDGDGAYSVDGIQGHEPLMLALEGAPSRPSKKVSEIDGDILLGGLMMVHERGPDSLTCGPIMPQGGIQALETMLYTVDYINSKKEILPGIALGVHILDDCDTDTRGLQESLDFIKGSISNIDDVDVGRCANDSVKKNKVISGVVGASSSVTSIQVANLLRLFKIPQVSFFSTSPELSNKQRYDFFARTIPSDKNQVQVMFDIIDKFGWKYVSIIYEESNYGTKALEELEKLLPKRNICIAAKEMLVKDSGVAEESSYDLVVKGIQAAPRAKGVIIFGSDQEVKALMAAVRRRNATGLFTWIGSDGWSSRTLVSDGNEREVEGTLSVQPRANTVIGFDEYFFNLNVKTNTRNPWFIEFWEHHFKCKFPNTTNARHKDFTLICTGEEKLKREDTEFEAQLQFVSDAVMAFAYALRDMHEVICGGRRNPGVCNKMKPVDGATLLGYLKNVSFVGLSKDTFHFDAFSDGPARYNIIHFRKNSDSDKYAWVPVGEYNEGNLTLDMSRIRFADGTSEPPVSVCSDACGPGEAKNRVSGSSGTCCWNCVKCTGDQIRHETNESTCVSCSAVTYPNPEATTCVPIPEEYLKPSSGWAIGAMTFAGIGILLTLFVLVVFTMHNDTPVVRASGREVSYVLLAGLFLCYALTFLFVVRPNDVICGIQQFCTGFCFTIVYAALLTKTNRIARIFQAGKKSARRPSFISPRSQLVICSLLLCIQVIVNVVWMLLQPPEAINRQYPTRQDNMLVCNSYIDASYAVAFAYPLTLIVVCTVYAVLTRKIPEAFNESKYIGFTMYTTSIIWLAFVPIYFSTAGQVALRIMSMTVAISLSATVMVACLFVPKLYIILVHPERNVRQSMMPATRYSAVQQQSNQAGIQQPQTAPPQLAQQIQMNTFANANHLSPKALPKTTTTTSTQSDGVGFDWKLFDLQVKLKENLNPVRRPSEGQDPGQDQDVVRTLLSRGTQTIDEAYLEYSTSSRSSLSVEDEDSIGLESPTMLNRVVSFGPRESFQATAPNSTGPTIPQVAPELGHHLDGANQIPHTT